MLTKINEAIEHNQPVVWRENLTASGWSHCDRALWYSLRNASWIHHNAETLRTFAMGHKLEDCIVEWLKLADFAISHQQAEIKNKWGKPLGHIDGILRDGKNFYLLEIKTANDKRFKDWIKNGAPEYYKAQVQFYMHHSSQLSQRGNMLTRCRFVVLNKNTSEIHIDEVEYDAGYAALQTERYENVTESESIPPKDESFMCNMCNHKAICQGEKCAEVNCRTCANVSCENGGFTCQFGNRTCPEHVFHPGLIEPLGFKLEGIDHKRRALIYDRFAIAPAGARFKDKATFHSEEFKECHDAGLITDDNIINMKQLFGGEILEVSKL